jgi:hypothetical protein
MYTRKWLVVFILTVAGVVAYDAVTGAGPLWIPLALFPAGLAFAAIMNRTPAGRKAVAGRRERKALRRK